MPVIPTHGKLRQDDVEREKRGEEGRREKGKERGERPLLFLQGL
jgi:hypothetical protein